MSKKPQEFFKTFSLEEVKKNFKECRVILKDIKHKIITRIVNHPKNQPTCIICSKTLSSNPHLQRHIKYFHSSELGFKFDEIECDFCGRMMRTKGEMTQHMKIHRPTVKCEICQAELKIRSLEQHLQNTHATERNFQCKICLKSFTSYVKLSRHKKYHDKSFECLICNRKFALKCLLLKHQKQFHENPRSYSCDICNRTFNLKQGMVRHRKIHQQYHERKYKCQKCNYAANRSDTFKDHLKVHKNKGEKFSGIKNPLKCPKCSTFCNSKTSLKKHDLYMHFLEPFKCDLCGKYTRRKNDMINHIKAIHLKLRK